MKKNKLLKFSLAVFVTLLLGLQSCEDKSSFGEDLQVAMLPTDLSYPDILNAREFVEIMSAAPFTNANGHPVLFELLSIKKGEEMLDASYLSHVSIKNYTVIESKVVDANDSLNPYIIYTNDLYEMGKITIAENDQFANGEYFFTVKVSAEINGATQSTVFENALRLYIGPDLADGIAYCPFKMNFVNGESTTSESVELFGGNPDVRYELGSDSDKLSIDAVTGALSLNSSYTVSATEYLYPIINVVSNVSEEVMPFEGAFTAVLSATPIVLEKEADYFFFPTLKTTAKKNVGLGGDGYSRVFVEHLGYEAGDPEENTDWYITNAMWKSHKKANKYFPPVPTPDAVAARDAAGVTGTTKLQVPLWTVADPSDSWIVLDPVNLALYEGCFTSKAVFWYNLNLANSGTNAGYELDGSTPIDLEVHITTNYTGDVNTTDWIQVNDMLECEINDNGTIFTGTPYPGDQSGVQPPNGVKDPSNSPNNLWVRGELNLEDYKTEGNFTIAFRLKTYFEEEPYSKDVNGNPAVNGLVQLSNVHFVASEK
jgi:hypothetical protein